MGKNDGGPCPSVALPLLQAAGTGTTPPGEAPASEGYARVRELVDQGNAVLVAMINLKTARDRDATPPGLSPPLLDRTFSSQQHLGILRLNLVAQAGGGAHKTQTRTTAWIWEGVSWGGRPQDADEANRVDLGRGHNDKHCKRGRHELGNNPSTQGQRAALGSWIKRGQKAAPSF